MPPTTVSPGAPAGEPGSPFGELLTAISGFGGQFLFNSILPANGGPVLHQLPVPNDPALAGLQAFAQAVVLGSPGTGGVLCNAIDLTAGF